MLGELGHAWGLCSNRAAVYLITPGVNPKPQLWETIVFALETREHLCFFFGINEYAL